MNNEQLIQNGSIGKLLVRLSIPAVVITMITVFYNFVDIFFMGQTGETLQVAAISLVSPAFSCISALGTLLGMGGCTAIAIALGQGHREKVKLYSSFCFWAALGVGIVLMGAGNLLMDPLVRLLGADQETAPYAQAYLRILSLGAPVLMLSNVLANILRADGSVKPSMISSLLGTGTNVLLDPLLILSLNGGIRGAAVATLLGNVVSALYLTLAMGKKKGFSRSLRDFSAKPQVSWKVIRLGLPMAAGTLLMSFSHMFGNNLRMSYGSHVAAANGVASMAGTVVTLVSMGMCMGIQPALSYAFGAGNHRRMDRIVRGTGLATVFTGLVLSALFLLFRDSWLPGFLADPQVVAMGKRMLWGVLCAAPFFGLYQISSCYLQSTGNVGAATFVSLLRQGILYIPALYGMNLLGGLTGLIFAGAVSDLLSTGLAVLLGLARRRKMAREEEAVPLLPGLEKL